MRSLSRKWNRSLPNVAEHQPELQTIGDHRNRTDMPSLSSPASAEQIAPVPLKFPALWQVVAKHYENPIASLEADQAIVWATDKC
jgi:hypothetical protein